MSPELVDAGQAAPVESPAAGRNSEYLGRDSKFGGASVFPLNRKQFRPRVPARRRFAEAEAGFRGMSAGRAAAPPPRSTGAP